MRKVIALIGALALVLAVAGPVAARTGTPPPDTGGAIFRYIPIPGLDPCVVNGWMGLCR